MKNECEKIMNVKQDGVIKRLQEKNQRFQKQYTTDVKKHILGQSPKIAVLTCADSRVIPEYIFQADIGDLFIVRVAGNIAVDETILFSLEYAVKQLHITHLIILAHTHCGAVKAAEQAKESTSLLLSEIQKSFTLKKDHVLANLNRQMSLLPQRSKSIRTAMETDSLRLIAALYHLENGHVEFL